MILVFNIFESIGNLIKRIWGFIKGAINALIEFYNQLDSFKATMQTMIDEMATGDTTTGIPVTAAIGTIRYCLGDTLFYAIYILILIGILFTIYKLVTVIINHVLNITSIFGNLGGTQGIIDKVTNLFKGW